MLATGVNVGGLEGAIEVICIDSWFCISNMEAENADI